MGGVGASPAPPPPHSENMSYQESAYNSLAPNTTTAAFDDYFAYNLADPITIRKNESAMVPILQTKIDAERVTLWSPRQPTPLRALWITNTSQLTLDRGSFSIVEDGNFGGEGLLDPIHPGEKRLLSYAVDQAVAISSTSGSVHNLRSVIIAKGVLVSHYRDIDTRDYAIRNAAAEPRTVVIEHNITTGAEWLLNPATSLVVGKDSTPIQPDEKLPTLYRFRVPIAPGATVHLKVAESHAYPREIQVGNIGDQQVKILLQDLHENAADNPDLLKQLQPVLDAQRKIADLNAQKKAADAELTSLHQEEDRQRANITALKDADRTARQRFVNDLGHTEDQIALEQKSQRQLDAQLTAAHQALADLAQQLQFDQTVTPTP